MQYPGILVLRERLRRNWSQEGLCSGICTVSYLSKIENGKAEPSEEILVLLFRRLGISRSEELNEAANDLAEAGYELLLSGYTEKLRGLVTPETAERYCAADSGLDLLLLAGFSEMEPVEEELEACMDTRQLALQRVLQNRYEQALRLMPCAYTYFRLGADAYGRGSYTLALEMLQMAYDLAARDGLVEIMLQSRLFIGNCYCSQLDRENMEKHYRAARRLAEAVGDEDALYSIGYNTAATDMECGRYAQAYTFFVAQKEPDMMSLHKLAICCEKTGRAREAFEALDAAAGLSSQYPPTEIADRLCELVRFRLEHPEYLKTAEYGRLLMDVFSLCRSKLSRGYASFHLPWVLEWCRANRQYRMAMELLEEFPEGRR